MFGGLFLDLNYFDFIDVFLIKDVWYLNVKECIVYIIFIGFILIF